MTSPPPSVSDFMRQRILARDKDYLDPRERANKVNTLIFHALKLDDPKDVIKNPLFWDLTCFACEFLSLFALQTEEEDLIFKMKAISKWIYSFHYSVDIPQSVLGSMTREEHEKVWLERFSSLIDEGTTGDDNGPKED